MKKLFTILFVCLFANVAFAQDNEPGAFDPTFGVDGTFRFALSDSHDILDKVLVQPDGKIITIGRSCTDGSSYSIYVSRHNVDGTLDETYGNGGKSFFKVNPAIYMNGAKDAVLAENGLLYITGWTFDADLDNSAYVLCLDENGFVFPMFGENGIMETERGNGIVYEAIDVDSQGRLVTAGYMNDNVLIKRYTTSGEEDLSVKLNPGESVFSNAFAVKVVENDDIIIGGFQMVVWYELDGVEYVIQKALVCKFKSDGTMDASFGNNGVVDIVIGEYAEFVNGISIDNDGNIIATGHSELPSINQESVLPRYESFVVRITKDGQVDKTFGENADGIVRFEAMVGDGCVNNQDASAVIAADGQIFGTFYSYNYNDLSSRAYVYNLDKDGKQNEEFVGGGVMGYPASIMMDGDVEIQTQSLALQDENLIVGGYIYHSEGAKADVILSRLFTSVELPEIPGGDTTSVGELNDNAFRVYPNPASSQLFVESEDNAQISIIDLTGRCVKEIEATDNVTTIALDDINEGVYFIMIQTENKRVVEKLIVR